MIRRKAFVRPVKQPAAPSHSGIGGGTRGAGGIGGGTTRASLVGGGGAGEGSSASAVIALLCRRRGLRGSSGRARDGSSAGARVRPRGRDSRPSRGRNGDFCRRYFAATAVGST